MTAPEVPPRPLDSLATAVATTRSKGPSPVDAWNPPFCGDIDMRIARDGTWFYLGTPIGRPALVRLFASILRKDAEGYRLVTPVEKVGIVVEDAPFLAVEMRVAPGPVLHLRTNMDDWVEIGAIHALRFEPGAADGIKPYVHVRGHLWALLTRALFYDLAALGETRDIDGQAMFGIASGASFFAIAKASTFAGEDLESGDIEGLNIEGQA